MLRPMLLCGLLLVAVLGRAEDDRDPEDLTRRDPAPACRLWAVGDVHGDLEMLQQALAAAGVIGRDHRWAAGCDTLVQTGDVTDRGADVLDAIDWLQGLRHEAAEAGGAVILLNGNHELMNFAGDVRFVSPALIERSGGAAEYKALFAPDGRYGALLRHHNFSARVHDTVFTHGGIRPEFAALGVAGINKEARGLLARENYFEGVFGDSGPLWTRDLIYQSREGRCGLLRHSLMLLGAQRMVVGHTPEASGKVGSYCGGRLVDIDIALSRAMGSGGHPGCVELLPDRRVKAFYGRPG